MSKIIESLVLLSFCFSVSFVSAQQQQEGELSVGYVNAQQEEADSDAPSTLNEAAPDNVPSTNGTDLLAVGGTTALTVGGLAAAFLKDRKDKKDVTNKFEDEYRAQAESINEYIALRTKLDNYGYVYKNYTYAQLLDLPAYNSPLDKTPIGQAMTTQANKIIRKAQTDYNVPLPQMAIASQSIVSASQNLAAPPVTQQETVKLTETQKTTTGGEPATTTK